MRNFVIGTAGHVDHGKTSIVERLTGHNTDTLIDEKRQGITIQLGFTSFKLSEHEVSVIDVPGHEKFVNHMVCGVHGFDLFMIVIAADDGIMPQTIEHLQILKLLGVKDCICVINKCDLVDEEWLELVCDDIETRIREFDFNILEICCVSAKTGKGIEELRNVISKYVELNNNILCKNNCNPRLPIDRNFTIQGFGTVVTGTLLDGSLSKSDRVHLMPGSKDVNIRGMQTHNLDTLRAEPGMRIAVNITGIDCKDVNKGDVLCLRNYGKVSDKIAVKLHILSDYKRKIKNNTRVRFFTGACDVIGRLRLLQCDLASAGDDCFAQVILEKEICCELGDRFVVRLYSPMETFGGGRILSLNKQRFRISDRDVVDKLKAIDNGDIAPLISEKCNNCNGFICLDDLLEEFNNNKPLSEILHELNLISNVEHYKFKGKTYLASSSNLNKTKKDIYEYLNNFAKYNPYKQGCTVLELCQNKRFSNINNMIILLDFMKNEGLCKIEGEYICKKDFCIVKDNRYLKVLNKLIDLINSTKFSVYKVNSEDFDDKEIIQDIIDNEIRENNIVKIVDDYYLTSKLLEELKKKLSDFCKNNAADEINVSDFRDLFNISRKYANLLMDYLQNNRFLDRVGRTSTYKIFKIGVKND